MYVTAASFILLKVEVRPTSTFSIFSFFPLAIAE
jgi:hypothetical protein